MVREGRPSWTVLLQFTSWILRQLKQLKNHVEPNFPEDSANEKRKWIICHESRNSMTLSLKSNDIVIENLVRPSSVRFFERRALKTVTYVVVSSLLT